MADQKPNRRVRWTLGAAAALLAIALAVASTGALDAGSGQAQRKSHGTSLATVVRGSLSSQLSAQGTLTYAAQHDGSSYDIVNQAPGIYSQLPAPGRTAARGEVLYRVSNGPVILLYGRTPTYRSLTEGDSGPDVRQLNRNLVALGYAAPSTLDPLSDRFSAATAGALEQLQDHLGEPETGALAVGQAVFLPGSIRISAVRATLGAKAHAGKSIAMGTSTTREVVVNLDASDQTAVRVGDQAQVTLPTGQRTPGAVSAIGTVTGSASGPVVPVYVTLNRPGAAGKLAQAPVQVEITTATVKHALVVPVDALMARAGGRYVIETVNRKGLHHLAAITLGRFDDADGTVQVTGNLHSGQRIVVPNI